MNKLPTSDNTLPTDSLSFGRQLRTIRERVGLTQAQARQSFGVNSGQAYRRYENGSHPDRGELINFLARCYHLNPGAVTPAVIRNLITAYSSQQALTAGEWQQIFGDSTTPTPPFFGVPPRNPLFIGREAELTRMLGLIGSGIRQAIVSTPGIGKTQIAVEFAYRVRALFPGGIFWLTMEEPESVAPQVAAYAGPGGLNLPGQAGLTFADAIAAVRAAWQLPDLRLLIFDNLEDPQLLDQWAPRVGGCHVLITSRRGIWAASKNVTLTALEPLDRSSSEELLVSSRARQQDKNPAQVLADVAASTVSAICSTLGDLPLAIALAAAYLEAYDSISLQQYYEQIQPAPITHPSFNQQGAEGLPTGHIESVAKTFALSYIKLEDSQPVDRLARVMLHHAAQAAPIPIPRRMLIRSVGINPDDSNTLPISDAAFRRLALLGLIELLPTGTLRLHRLIAEFARHQSPTLLEDQLAVEMALSWEVYASHVVGNTQLGLPYLEHLRVAIQRARNRDDASALMMIANYGQLLRALGDLQSARSWLARSLALCEQILGPIHPATALNLNFLGSLLMEQGHLEEAQPLMERAAAIDEAVLGPIHPDTIFMLTGLGTLLLDQGNIDEAQPLLERAVAAHQDWLMPERVIPVFDPVELASLQIDNLDFSGARALLEQAFAIRGQVLGTSWPQAGFSFSALARLREQQGDLRGAYQLYQRSLAIFDQALGSMHRTTGQTTYHLARVVQKQGDLSTAQTLYEKARAIQEQSLGRNHFETALTINALAELYETQGKLAEARSLYADIVEIYRKTFGSNHPTTVEATENLIRIAAS